MKPLVIVTDGMDKNEFKRLTTLDGLSVHEKSKLTKDELYAILPNAEGLIIRSDTKVNAELLEYAPKLKIVIRAGEGTDNIDKALCTQKGVVVENTPGANNNSAAEHAVALMMSVLRYTAQADQSMHQGKWEKNLFTGVELWKKKVGIVGFGRIGQIVTQRISGFEPEVLFFDPIMEKSPFPFAKKANDLKEIFSTCDIISIHVPLIPQTKNMITKDLLGLMKPSAILINAARGGIVNEEDLFQVLSEKKIRGAGFDVFETEPVAAGNKLATLSNIIMTPHLGASTEEAQIRVGTMAVDQIHNFFKNGTIENQVLK